MLAKCPFGWLHESFMREHALEVKLPPILSHDVSRALGGEDKADRASRVVGSAVHLREAVIIHHAEKVDGRPVSREFCERFCQITFMPVTVPV
jgi:hypothetical protein